MATLIFGIEQKGRCSSSESSTVFRRHKIGDAFGDDLEETAVLEVVLDDDIGDGVKDESDVVGVGGARKMGVHLLEVFALVQVFELHLDVMGALVERLGT